MKIYITLISLILTIFSCSNEHKESITKNNTIDSITQIDQVSANSSAINSITKKSNIDFEEYISSLDQISLPLKHNALGKLPEISVDYNKEGFEKYSYSGTSKPLGILYKDNNIVTLVDCSIGDWGLAPFITTYDLSGNKIDSLGPYKKSGEGEGYYAIEYINMQPNKTLIVEDTVITWPAQEDRTKLNEKVSIERIKYTFESSGRISSGE
jgi:hypothetical protein